MEECLHISQIEKESCYTRKTLEQELLGLEEVLVLSVARNLIQTVSTEGMTAKW